MREIIKKIINKTCEAKNQEVDLKNLGIFDNELSEIVDRINQDPNITSLILYRNNIRDAGAKLLAGLKYVQYLDLGYNNISDEGVVELLKSDIGRLDLNSNNFTDKVADLIDKHAKQHTLNISRNNLSEKSSRIIRERIDSNKEEQSTQRASLGF